MNLRAEIVREPGKDPLICSADRSRQVYGSISTEEPQIIEDFARFSEDIVSRIGPQIAVTYVDFGNFPDLVVCIPILRAKEQKLFTVRCSNQDRMASASKLLAEAKRWYKRLAQWPFVKRQDLPYKSFPLPQSGDQSHPVYPSSINVFPESSLATVFDSWRISQAYVLGVVARLGKILRSLTANEKNALDYTAEIGCAEKKIRELIDGFCCSIPYSR